MRGMRVATTLGACALVAACSLWPTSPGEDTCVERPRNDLERNICSIDADCEYIWFTGGCYTPESVAKEWRQATCEGRHVGEAPPREGVTCTCETKSCVTHG
jgi:hypothetical protein